MPVRKSVRDAEADESYVLIIMKHDFDLVVEDANGNFVPVDPVALPDNAYVYRGMIGEVHFPKTRSIGKNCFKMCSSLEVAEIPNAQIIKDSAFLGCVALRSIDTPLLMMIGNNVFQDCASLSEINMPVVSTIGYNAFQDCSALQTVSMPQLTEMGDYCFRGCTSITDFNAPIIQNIGRAAFYGCENLSKAIFPMAVRIGMGSSNQGISEGVFQGCSNLQTVVLPSIDEIQANTFKECSSVKRISLPRTPAVGLPQNAFSDCVNLEWLNISCEVPIGNMQEYRADLGICDTCSVICLNGDISFGANKSTDDSRKSSRLAYKHDSTTVHGGVQCNYIETTTGTITGTISECFACGIMANAFENQTEMETAFLPNIYYRVGSKAFKGCTKLKQVFLPRKWMDGLDSEFAIANDAFQNCPKLMYLELTNATVEQVNAKKGSNIWGLKNNTGCVIACKDGTITI